MQPSVPPIHWVSYLNWYVTLIFVELSDFFCDKVQKAKCFCQRTPLLADCLHLFPSKDDLLMYRHPENKHFQAREGVSAHQRADTLLTEHGCQDPVRLCILQDNHIDGKVGNLKDPYPKTQ